MLDSNKLKFASSSVIAFHRALFAVILDRQATFSFIQYTIFGRNAHPLLSPRVHLDGFLRRDNPISYTGLCFSLFCFISKQVSCVCALPSLLSTYFNLAEMLLRFVRYLIVRLGVNFKVVITKSRCYCFYLKVFSCHPSCRLQLQRSANYLIQKHL